MKDVSDVLDWLPYCLLVVLPVFIALSPVNPVEGAVEFPAHRLAQFETGGASYGSKAAAVASEARDPSASRLLRKAVVVGLQNLSVTGLNEILKAGASGLVLLVPEEKELASLPAAVLENIRSLEDHLLTSQIEIPVYFAGRNAELGRLSAELRAEASGSGAVANEIFGSGYQLVATGAPKALPDPAVVSMHGLLPGKGDSDALPAVLIVAHYDAQGAAPGMSHGDGSGVAVVLELARLWNKLYASSRTRPKYNLVFLLSGGGKLNYFGTKKWLEEHQDTDQSSEILSNVAFVVCLDGVGEASNDLYFHVSKPPKEDSAASKFFKDLRKAASLLRPSASIELVHKKINLADDFLGWEHEQFSIHRLSAFTLSASPTPFKGSILDVSADSDAVVRNTRLIAEAIACTVYGGECDGSVFREGTSLAPDARGVAGWLAYLRGQPRDAGLLTAAIGNKKMNPDRIKLHPLLQSLSQTLKARSGAFKTLFSPRDKRDPEFEFYDTASVTMNAYRVKSAVFDLVLTAAIAAYLGAVYFALLKAGAVVALWKSAMVKKSHASNGKVESNGNGNAHIKSY